MYDFIPDSLSCSMILAHGPSYGPSDGIYSVRIQASITVIHHLQNASWNSEDRVQSTLRAFSWIEEQSISSASLVDDAYSQTSGTRPKRFIYFLHLVTGIWRLPLSKGGNLKLILR
jgi:hypothetical protein